MFRYLPPVHFPQPLSELAHGARSALVGGEAELARATRFLEQRFPDRRVHLVASGTGALALAIRWSHAGRPTAPLVALPAYGCPDLGAAAVAAGAGVLLYDVEPATLQPDWESLSEVLRAGASHVVVAHLYGRPADVPRVRQLASTAGAIVIEDAAQGADASWAGTPAGSLAEWAIFSLGRGKGINAGGGGILLAPQHATLEHLVPERHDSLLREMRHLFVLGATQLMAWPYFYRLPVHLPWLRIGQTRYHALDTITAMTNVAARLLPSAFEQSSRAAAMRRALEKTYLEALSERRSLVLPPVAEASQSGALRVPVLVHPERVRALRAYGVVRSYPRHLAEYAEIRQYLASRRALPGATQLAETLHTLPTHAHVRNVDVRHIVRELSRLDRSPDPG